MRPKARHALGVAGVVAVFLMVSLVPLGRTADHLDQPFPGLPPAIDITDVYAFHPGTSEQDLNKVVFVVNVHPLTMPGMSPQFSTDARYLIKVDTNGDAVADIAYRFTFDNDDDDDEERQRVRVETLRGWNAQNSKGSGRTSAQGWTESIVRGAGNSWLFAGLRDDPFFFDLLAFRGLHSFCDGATADTFKGFNVMSIVWQVPTRSLGKSANIGVWATIEIPMPNDDDDEDDDRAPGPGATGDDDDGDGRFVQQDRMGRPAINTVLISTGNKAAFNAGDPKDDPANFKSDVVAHLIALDPLHRPARADFLASILLPDVLTFDTSAPSGFLNGRRLADDVIDAELSLLTDGALPGDCVDGNDVAFLGVFPYLAPPQ